MDFLCGGGSGAVEVGEGGIFERVLGKKPVCWNGSRRWGV